MRDEARAFCHAAGFVLLDELCQRPELLRHLPDEPRERPEPILPMPEPPHPRLGVAQAKVACQVAEWTSVGKAPSNTRAHVTNAVLVLYLTP